ncbi:unnamed protein product [Victoria cruziana]
MSIIPATPTQTVSDENDSNMVQMTKSITQKRPSRLRSAVWNDFERIKKNGKDMAVCNLCKKEFVGGTSSGTSHLKKHLERCPRRANADDSQQLLSARKRRRERTVTVSNVKFSQERSRLDLAHMIILHGYPFSMVEHIGFRVFVNNLQPAFNMVSLDTVKADCLAIYEKENEKLKEILANVSGKVSLTTEMWTSCENVAYLCLVGHFIDDGWALQRKILNFVMVGSPHTGEALSEILESCLMEWNIPHKVFAITLDDSLENGSLVTRIRESLYQKRLLLTDAQPFHMRCAAHVLNMVVQDGLTAVHDVIHKIRETIKYIKSSQTREQKFNEAVHQARVHSQRSLCLDIPTQWSSTYLMIEGALEYKDALFRMQKLDSSYTFAPTAREWEMASNICIILKPFIEITDGFAGTKFPTSNLYFPPVCSIMFQLNQWGSSGDAFVRSVALKMKETFDTYWATCSLILAVAVILDPRFKMKLVEYYYPQIYGINAAEQIKDTYDGILSLYNEYATRSSSTLPSQDGRRTGNGNRNESGVNLSMNLTNDPRDMLKGFDEYLSETSQNHQSKTDLDLYLEEAVFPRNVEFNILNWWKVNTPKYPVLARMARDVLAIPVSTVELDSTFNTGSKMLDTYRSSLDLQTLQALMCAQDWLQEKLDVSPLSTCYSESAIAILNHV